jgi:hypothetical protein
MTRPVARLSDLSRFVQFGHLPIGGEVDDETETHDIDSLLRVRSSQVRPALSLRSITGTPALSCATAGHNSVAAPQRKT